MEPLFLTVLQMGISVSWLILAVAAARVLFGKIPRNMFCMMWMVVGLRLICPWMPQTDFSLIPERTGAFWETMNPAHAMQEYPKTETGNMPDVSHRISENSNVAEQTRTAPAAESLMVKISAIAAWIWLAGILVMCAYLVFCWYRVKKKVAEAVPAVSGGIRFYQCDRISSPFLFGLFAPKIYVPFSVSGQELTYVLKHEVMHKKRLDHLAKMTGYLLLAVYWFQPLVWAAYLLFCRDIELACDERVIRQVGENGKKEYSQALLLCSVNRRTSISCPVAFGEIGVKKRVKKILEYKIPKFRAVAAAAIVCTAVTLGFGTEARGKSSVIPQSETKTGTLQTDPDLADTITVWAEAFCDRDAGTIYKMLDVSGKKVMREQNMLEGEHSFGWSSPWPWNVDRDQPDFRILSIGEHTAEILYYAWTSDPHITVWHQVITYTPASGKNALRIQDVSSEMLDNIHSAKQFYTAYPDGIIDHTKMDYLNGNGAGKALNQNAQTGSIQDLYQPDTAAVFLLNIQPDDSVTVKASEKNGEMTVSFIFLEDGGTASVKMIQPYGKKGIWVPQTV